MYPRYGEFWSEYVARVPNVFFPNSMFFYWILSGADCPIEAQKNEYINVYDIK